jgi:hypothetical protein
MPTSLLDLPTELRLMVYSHFAVDPDGWSSVKEAYELTSANRGLLLACKTIRCEALPEFHDMAKEYFASCEKKPYDNDCGRLSVASSNIFGHAKITWDGAHGMHRHTIDGIVQFHDWEGFNLPLIWAGIDSVTYVTPAEFTIHHPASQIKMIDQYLGDGMTYWPGSKPSVVHIQWKETPMGLEEANECLNYEEGVAQKWREGSRDHVLTLHIDKEKSVLKGMTWTYKGNTKMEKETMGFVEEET